ncbi:MAG: hypothetical protein M0P33_02650 [Massilibacteroides sp.]|nr:hypothetical protein [Massilibacteroides sp.]
MTNHTLLYRALSENQKSHLPSDFELQMLKRIKKRATRKRLISEVFYYVVLASCISAGVYTIYYYIKKSACFVPFTNRVFNESTLTFQRMSHSFLELNKQLHLFYPIALMALFLLGLDFIFRSLWKKKMKNAPPCSK